MPSVVEDFSCRRISRKGRDLLQKASTIKSLTNPVSSVCNFKALMNQVDFSNQQWPLRTRVFLLPNSHLTSQYLMTWIHPQPTWWAVSILWILLIFFTINCIIKMSLVFKCFLYFLLQILALEMELLRSECFICIISPMYHLEVDLAFISKVCVDLSDLHIKCFLFNLSIQ